MNKKQIEKKIKKIDEKIKELKAERKLLIFRKNQLKIMEELWK